MKYSGVIAYSLIIIAFLIDIIMVVSSFPALTELEGPSRRIALYLLLLELLISGTLIVNSLFGIKYLFNPRRGDIYSSLRRGTDGLGGLAGAIALIQIFTIVELFIYAKTNNTKLDINPAIYIIIALFLVATVLAVIASTKKIPIRTAKKAIMGIIASVFVLVGFTVLVAMTAYQSGVLEIVYEILCIASMLALGVFFFFNYEDSRNSYLG